MKIISYNVNGIRAAINKGFYTWLEAAAPDIIGLQEIKASPDQVDLAPLEALGYQHYWFPAEKKGYSGVAVFSKIAPDYIETGIGHPMFDAEGRIIRLDFGDITLLNCYFPSGTTGDIRQTVKYEFLDYFFNWVEQLRQTRPNLVIMGDYNIAHNNIDIHNPKGNATSSGFLPEERAWMDKWFAAGFTDSFRQANPNLQKYSWWSFRAGARGNNKGWRIDYISLCGNLPQRIASADLLNDAEHSDHCPCVLNLA